MTLCKPKGRFSVYRIAAQRDLPEQRIIPAPDLFRTRRPLHRDLKQFPGQPEFQLRRNAPGDFRSARHHARFRGQTADRRGKPRGLALGKLPRGRQGPPFRNHLLNGKRMRADAQEKALGLQGPPDRTADGRHAVRQVKQKPLYHSPAAC